MSHWKIDLKQLTLAACAVGVGMVCAGARVLAAVQEPQGFVPAADIAKESLPATPLLYGAYAFVWLVLIGYVFLLWRRLDRVETELRDVSSRLSSGARR